MILCLNFAKVISKVGPRLAESMRWISSAMTMDTLFIQLTSFLSKESAFSEVVIIRSLIPRYSFFESKSPVEIPTLTPIFPNSEKS